MGRWLELEEWRGGYGGEPGREGERRARGTGGVGGRVVGVGLSNVSGDKGKKINHCNNLKIRRKN